MDRPYEKPQGTFVVEIIKHTAVPQGIKSFIDKIIKNIYFLFVSLPSRRRSKDF